MQLPVKCEIIFPVNEQYLQEIEQWLSDANNKEIHGFYNHWDIITSKQRINRMMCLRVKDSVIGFITWVHDFSDPFQKIEYMAILDKFQGKGYGQLLVSECFKYFIKNGIKAVNLQSISEQSDAFWTKMGFSKYPKEYNNNRFHYKFLVENQKPMTKPVTNEIIEVWPTRFWNEDTPPSYLFEIRYIEGTNMLQKPIIMLCDDGWRIRWRNKETIYKDSQIKRFYKNDFIDFNEILIIDKLEQKP